MKHTPKQIDFAVEVIQGSTRKTWNIMAPTKQGAINQANRILKIQRVQPAKVIAVRERKP